MKKIAIKVLSIVVFMTILASMIVLPAHADGFIDTQNLDEDCQEALQYCVDNGYINGYEDGSFRPYGNITRAEFATIICKFMGYDATEYSTFDDMQNHWASQAVQACVTHNAISGVGDNLYAPDDYVTYEQADKIILLAKGYTRDYRIEKMGGYPWGYMKYATWIGLLMSCPDLAGRDAWKSPNIPAKRINIASMLYNTTYVDWWIENEKITVDNLYVGGFNIKNYTNKTISEFMIYDESGYRDTNFLDEPIPPNGEGAVTFTDTNPPDIYYVALKIGDEHYYWESEEGGVDLLYYNHMEVGESYEDGGGYYISMENCDY